MRTLLIILLLPLVLLAQTTERVSFLFHPQADAAKQEAAYLASICATLNAWNAQPDTIILRLADIWTITDSSWAVWDWDAQGRPYYRYFELTGGEAKECAKSVEYQLLRTGSPWAPREKRTTSEEGFNVAELRWQYQGPPGAKVRGSARAELNVLRKAVDDSIKANRSSGNTKAKRAKVWKEKVRKAKAKKEKAKTKGAAQ